MSSYPPGVTGNEPQIAGYPSTMVARTCRDARGEATRTEWLPVARIREEIDHIATSLHAALTNPDAAQGHVLQAGWPLAALRQATFDDAAEFECDFDGDVEVELHGSTEVWRCPTCWTLHEEDATPEPREGFDWDD